MGDMLLVDFGAMQRASGDIQAALNALHHQLDLLEHDAAGMVATWDGDARDAYQVRQDRWRHAASDLSAMLADIKHALDDSMTDYLNAERRNAGLFR